MKPVVKYLCLPFAAIIPLFFFQCQGTDVYNEPFETEYFIFPEDRSAFPNPERGWYMTATTEKASKNSMSWIKDENASMVLLESNIGGFLTGELSQQKIDEIDSALSYAAQAGLSVIFRAAYTFAYNKKPEPEDINIILGHIGQLKPVFYKHEDILFNVQAGFLGPW
ncbi:MAG: DUF4874 domain-containing protein, partial [Treponema sp.]|nr:DUF4874 domain-containing protein [Treponema sp.]